MAWMPSAATIPSGRATATAKPEGVGKAAHACLSDTPTMRVEADTASHPSAAAVRKTVVVAPVHPVR